ncbi:MAG: 2-amino-4-hydroxy-6-hydroxymethyldihydropteridine diphosphokinase [Balneolaceae bacterium]|nr:MAG: 2-amino-4-hydroxy-6-hydroxymethyldihydropteridine diphosphokinase [Balneolaceae bacterium]
MEKVIIAVGSNLGDRLNMLQKAGAFLEELSESEVKKASVWESEPVGGAKFSFYNSVAQIETALQPLDLLNRLKAFEQKCGREKNPERWAPRILDMDIILYGNLVIHYDTLIIPHQEYKKRQFVLYPLQEINPDLHDPKTKTPIAEMMEHAPEIEISKTDLIW